MPGGFGGQQQPQGAGRGSNRLPNGKLANNAGWAFGGGVPMAGAGPQTQGRQLGGNVSFAQSLSGSQPATPLDLSEFPSLSNNPQISSASQPSMWSAAGPRNLSGPIQRNQSTPLSSQQGGQDDLFSPNSSRGPSVQGGFRFGNQGNLGQSSQAQSGSVDDFPPLNRTANGDIGSDRAANLMSSLGFGSQAGASGPVSNNRGNGLLNALSANSRANEARSPPGIGAPGSSRPQDHKPAGTEEDPRQKSATLRGDGPNAATTGGTSPLGAIGNDDSAGKLNDDEPETPEVINPLAGMPAVDRWGIKGLRTLMNNYPDYHAMVVGMDPTSLGLDITSQDLFSTQNYSLFDDSPPRPAVAAGKFRLPDCYNVTNVQPIESKIQSFNEETLFWIFYSCTADIKQQMAAVELHSRNWRWHKKLQLWLTKDEHMTPQILSPNHERGFYIVWDTASWRKERREFTLHYGDLDTTLNQTQVVPVLWGVTRSGQGSCFWEWIGSFDPWSGWDDLVFEVDGLSPGFEDCTSSIQHASQSTHKVYALDPGPGLVNLLIVHFNRHLGRAHHRVDYPSLAPDDVAEGPAYDTTMSNEQISLPYFLAILVVSGLIIRYLFFGGPSPPPAARSPEAFLRSREVAVERIQQMFPQADRRSILWDLQRNGGNIQNTTERILAGRLDAVCLRPSPQRCSKKKVPLLTAAVSLKPPITFQPPPPPGHPAGSGSAATAIRQPEKPAQPDLITRYNLRSKLDTSASGEDAKSKGWSSNRDERQASLQRRRDEMILAARRKMEAKIAAETSAQGS
ncbi:hypothetical protein ACJZ2D_004373 [Fusarium nematophilum]